MMPRYTVSVRVFRISLSLGLSLISDERRTLVYLDGCMRRALNVHRPLHGYHYQQDYGCWKAWLMIEKEAQDIFVCLTRVRVFECVLACVRAYKQASKQARVCVCVCVCDQRLKAHITQLCQSLKTHISLSLSYTLSLNPSLSPILSPPPPPHTHTSISLSPSLLPSFSYRSDMSSF